MFKNLSVMEAMVAWILVVTFSSVLVSATTDRTIVPDVGGIDVVVACLAKISASEIFAKDDQQFMRRISFVETNDGQDSNTYSDPSNNGGIWQLSESKYMQTISSSNPQFLQDIENIFGIRWISTSWIDLRKPFFSALGARLYLEILVGDQEFAFSTDIQGQSQFWKTMYTSSDKTREDYEAGAIKLNEAERCEVGALDVFYLLDDSGSVTEPNFNITKDFLSNLTLNFPVGADRVRVGLITFEYEIRIRFFLNTYNNTEDVITAIDATPYNGEGTNTSGALEVVRQQGFTEANGARAKELGIPRIAIVVTDGLSYEPNKTIESAAKLHNDGVLVYAIGIENANEMELQGIASDERFAVSVDGFDQNILSALQVSISRLACTASPTLSITDEVENTISGNETKYIDYPFPRLTGVTIKVNSTTVDCTVVLYISSFVATPSQPFHDIKLETSEFEDAFIQTSDLFNPNITNRLYIAISIVEGSSCTVRINAEEGDTSTEPVRVVNFLSEVFRTIGDDLDILCTATGNPKPTIRWYLNNALLNSQNGAIEIVELSDASNNRTSISSLKISSLKESNEGTYTCTASNVIPSGRVSDSSSFNLEVLSILEACPVKGSDACDERTILAACQYLALTLSAVEVPLPCKNRLQSP